MFFFHLIFFIFFFHIKDSSAKYYHDNKKKITKRASEWYQSLSKEEKEKKYQYTREQYKNLLEDEKQKLVEYRSKYYKMRKKRLAIIIKYWTFFKRVGKYNQTCCFKRNSFFWKISVNLFFFYHIWVWKVSIIHYKVYAWSASILQHQNFFFRKHKNCFRVQFFIL